MQNKIFHLIMQLLLNMEQRMCAGGLGKRPCCYLFEMQNRKQTIKLLHTHKKGQPMI